MRIKACFVQHASEDVQIKKIAHKLKSEGIDFVFVCKTQSAYKSYLKDGYEAHFISDVFESYNQLTDNQLVEIENRYASPGLAEIGSSDVHLLYRFGGKISERNKLIAAAIIYWESFIKTHKVDFFLSREVSSFSERTAYEVAKKLEIPHSIFHRVSPSAQHFILADIEGRHIWSELLNEVAQGPKKLTDKERAVVKEFIKKRTSKSDRSVPIRTGRHSFFGICKNILVGVWVNTFRKPADDPVWTLIMKYGWHRQIKLFIWRYITPWVFSYDKFDPDKKYLYFPLFTGLEASYINHDHFWAMNQLSLIEEIAGSLPHGYELYVKEHPTNPGFFTFYDLKKLKSLKNVKVLHPSVSNSDIDNNTDLTIVMQGTAGWESFLNKRPVLALGKPFYYHSDLIYKVGDIRDFSKVMWTALRTGPSVYEEREDEWLWFIWLLISTAHEGTIINRQPPFRFCTDEENVEKFTKAIRNKIKKSKNYS